MTAMTSPTTVGVLPTGRTLPTTATTRRRRALGVGAAVAANSLLYLAARAAGTDFLLTAPSTTQAHQLILPEIAGFSLVFALLGWGTLAVLERYTRHARVLWSVLAGTVLLASFVPVFLNRATVDTRILLCVSHVVVAAALLPMLRHAAGARPTAR